MVPHIDILEVTFRLAVTAVLCAGIGIEREVRDRAAGIRTHILVGIGAALFTLVSAYGFSDFLAVSGSGGASQRLVDPTRIAAQIVSGIGFLGAGVIIVHRGTVRGVTTAASLWVVAAVGLAVGAGFYYGGIATTVIALACLYGLRKLRPSMLTRIKPNRGVLMLEVETVDSIGKVLWLLHRNKIDVKNVDEEDPDEDDNSILVTIGLKQESGQELEVPLKKIKRVEGVLDVSVQGIHYP